MFVGGNNAVIGLCLHLAETALIVKVLLRHGEAVTSSLGLSTTPTNRRPRAVRLTRRPQPHAPLAAKHTPSIRRCFMPDWNDFDSELCLIGFVRSPEDVWTLAGR